MQSRSIVLLAAGVLLLGACARDPQSDTLPATPAPAGTTSPTVPPVAGPQTPGSDQTVPAGASDLPSVSVVDVATEQRVDLASLAPAQQPVLLWFWAPH